MVGCENASRAAAANEPNPWANHVIINGAIARLAVLIYIKEWNKRSFGGDANFRLSITNSQLTQIKIIIMQT